MTPLQLISDTWIQAASVKAIGSVTDWAVRNVKLVGSALSDTFDISITPWLREPLECAIDGTQKMTLIGPVQSGKSVVGEIAICYWLATQNGGDCQYLWQNDEASDARYDERFEKILRACLAVVARSYSDRFKWKKGLVIFPHANLIMQGVSTPRAVASKSIRFQVREEIHDSEGGWSEGRLDQADGRLTAFWNSVSFDISNSSRKGDQLHKAFMAKTRQQWQVKCPGCGLFHVMRARWEDKHPELGGLRYDSEGCRLENGDVIYSKLAPTVRYQMPCGYIVRDNVRERRALSLSGCYSAPAASSVPGQKSFILEAVSVDYISWISLIQQKHQALAAKDNGNPDPWFAYLRERESQFIDPARDRYSMPPIVLSENKTKQKPGLPGRIARIAAADRQKGTRAAGELPHWWHVVADVETLSDGRVHILIVSEGKVLTDANLVATFRDHDVKPSAVLIDSGWDTDHVYEICMEHGYYCVKGGGDSLFAGHEDGSKKIYSPAKPLHAMINQSPRFDYVTYQGELCVHPEEPMFMHYSKYGLLDFFAWLRTSPKIWFEIPSDVSQDFQEHLMAWGMEQKKKSGSDEIVKQWKQYSQSDHLLMCCCYVGLLLLDAELIGV